MASNCDIPAIIPAIQARAVAASLISCRPFPQPVDASLSGCKAPPSAVDCSLIGCKGFPTDRLGCSFADWLRVFQVATWLVGCTQFLQS
jgi:hypothetical protein